MTPWRALNSRTRTQNLSSKLIVPENIASPEFKDEFIKTVLEHVADRNLKVVPTSPEIAGFLRKNKRYKELLPVGIKL